METARTVIGILLVLAVGVVSPGPSFLLVAQTAVAHSRKAAVASSIGMAFGATLLCVVSLLGLHVLLLQVPVAYTALKAVGGLYLLYLAYRIWSHAEMPVHLSVQPDVSAAGPLRHFALALGTMVSNPKAAVQYGVIFAAMLPNSLSPALLLVLPVCVFVLEASWYLVVALALSASKPRATYLRAKATIDRTAGVVLGALGIKLLVSSR